MPGPALANLAGWPHEEGASIAVSRAARAPGRHKSARCPRPLSAGCRAPGSPAGLRSPRCPRLHDGYRQGHGQIQQDTLAGAFAKRFMAEPCRGYGKGAFALLGRIARGEDWRMAAPKLFGYGSYGNGAAMRVAPIGGFFGGDPSLNLLVPEVILDEPQIAPLVREVIAARVPQLVRVGVHG